MNYFRDNIDKLHGYVPGHQPGPEAIKLNTNENPYPCSPRVLEVIQAADAEDLRKYPQVYWDDFREAAGKALGVAPQRIVCGNGGDEILTILVRCCCDQNRPLAYPVPTYSLYPILAGIQDCPTREIPFTPEGQLPEQLFGIEAGLTILCNPNAPTCRLFPVEQCAELAASLKGVLLIDEAYVDFSDWNCLELLEQFDNVAILRSLSKGYSLAGLRFGFCMTSEKIVEAMCQVKDSYNVDALTQLAATAAMTDQAWKDNHVAKVVAERTRLADELRKLGFVVPESQTNFLLVQVPADVGLLPARTIQEQLQAHNIYIRYFNSPDLTDKLRITVGTPEQNDALIAALTQINAQKA